MKNLFLLLLLIIGLVSCKSSGGGGGAAAISCGSFNFTTEMLETTYTGTTVTTSGNCDNGGQEYIIAVDGDYTVASSVTGWRFISNVLTTNAGNLTTFSGGRFQTTDGVNEGLYMVFTGTDNTLCQAAHTVNTTEDGVKFEVTAGFDSSCNPQLTGTFKEYSACAGGNPEVVVCSGTITLTQ